VKGVVAIPLIEERAIMTLNTLASRNAELSRPSLIHKNNATDATHVSDIDDEGPDNKGPSPRVVQFLDAKQARPVPRLSSQEFNLDHDRADLPPVSSGASTPSSEDSVQMSNVAKALAARLSFWSRLSKRTSLEPTVVGEAEPLMTEHQELESIINGKEKPSDIIQSILAATAPPPVTPEEKHSELEDKIVREVIREYTKGGMYFAYNFGTACSARSGSFLLICGS
jgi:phosphatidylinositol 4-phosphatase